jgi:hypothetical protein
MSYYMNVLVQRWNALGDKDEEYMVGGCKLNHNIAWSVLSYITHVKKIQVHDLTKDLMFNDL